MIQKAKLVLTFTALCAANSVFAAEDVTGDPEAGAKAFNQCKSCHIVADDAGDVIVRGGKTGPNLWGLPGRVAGTATDYKYKKSLVAAGEGGLKWDESSFVAFIQDPNRYLKEFTGDNKARSGMAFRIRDAQDAIDIWAYLSSVSP